MKPIRSNELEFWTNFVASKFSDKRQDIDTEISQKAQEVADKSQEAFNKKCGVDKILKEAKKKYEAWQTFRRNKISTEEKLEREFTNTVSLAQEKLTRLEKSRRWDVYFGDSDCLRDLGKLERKLAEANYEEAKKEARKIHKVYNMLGATEESCKVDIHTGADIKDVVSSLKGRMTRVEIPLDISNNLLALPSK
tara:strand:- start:262 stop:843 length:582 start_codon:yes stop_codon:yes gene_type:complete